MEVSSLEIVASVCFLFAILHTFAAGKFAKIGHRYPPGSVMENVFHFLGEVEVVFGLWSAVFLTAMVISGGSDGFSDMVHYLEGLNFTEPAFVFVIMCMAGTRPVILMAEKAIVMFAKPLPLSPKMAFYCSALVWGPLLGSFITEPAAMTVTALILLDTFFSQKGSMTTKFKYATLGLLFVNISIGGTLTHFAAPPVLMVAGKWGWGISHMLGAFGWKAVIAIHISTFATAWIFRKELQGPLVGAEEKTTEMNPTWWIYALHIFFLAMVVVSAHHMVFFLGLFLFFLGFMDVTKEYQDTPKITESLLVGFFLAGLIVLGSMQKWWLQPVLTQLGDIPLFFGATALTAITDNAALTYLGSLVELTDSAKYFLVAGAVAGGGLTVIANAPNPAGYGLLKDSFGEKGVSPLYILLGALPPTFVALACFGLLPTITF